MGSETGDPEDVDDAEQGLHAHLENHGDGEEEDGAGEGGLGIVVVAAADGGAHIGPKAGVTPRHHSSVTGPLW